MQCKDLELVLESQDLGTLSPEARQHLADCASCQGLLADFHSIIAVASTLPAEIEPPARLWTSIRAQLEAEGLIQEPVEAPEAAHWWESLRAAFEIRSFAAVTAGVLVVASTIFFYTRKAPTGQAVAIQTPATQVKQPQQQALPTTAPPASPVAVPGGVIANSRHRAPVSSGNRGLAPSPSDNMNPGFSQDEPSFPDMQLAGNSRVDSSLRQNLDTLNQFIAECQRRLRQNPQDELAREYLNMAYQQKADLLAAMMENGRSEH
jgi:hypothetical protein